MVDAGCDELGAATRAASTPRAWRARVARRGGPRAGGRAPRRPAARGRVHQRRHRGDRRRRRGARRRARGAPPGRARRGRALGGARRRRARRAGDAVTVVGVDGAGRVDPDDAARRRSRPDTALVHVQWGNHEVGTLQPVAEVVAALPRARRAGARRRGAGRRATCPIDFGDLGADLLSVSAPQVRRPARHRRAAACAAGCASRRCCVGGDQERARRAGLENVPAHRRARRGRRRAGRRRRSPTRPRPAAALTDRRARRGRPRSTGVHGATATPTDRAPPPRLPRHRRRRAPGACCSASTRPGIAAHSGSACASEALEPSPVLEAMGVDAHRSLRMSVGWSTDADDRCGRSPRCPRSSADLRSLAS